MANIKEAFQYAAQNPNSDFAKNLEQLAASGSLDQEAQKYGIDTSVFKPKPTYLDNLQGAVAERVVSGQDTLARGFQEIKTAKAQNKGIGEAARIGAVTGLNIAGQVFGAVGDLQANALITGYQALPEDTKASIEAQVKELAGSEVGKLGIQALQQGGAIYADFKRQNPDMADRVEALGNILSAVPGIKIASKVPDVLETGVKVAGKTADAVVDTTKAVAKTTGDVASTIKTATAPITNIPSNIKTNVAQKVADVAEIKALPTKTAQEAVQSGINIKDARVLPKLVTSPKAKELLTAVKNLANGVEGADPVAVVGNLTTQAFKDLTAKAKTVGSQLGEVAKNIGDVDPTGVQDAILNRLKKVTGLEGLKFENGTLDFGDTTLANFPESVSAITNTFNTTLSTAQKASNGSKLHMFRQGLFEDLGGKKKSLANLSATDENAINAIRGGIADAIETASPDYKKLSMAYAKLTEPLSKLKKALRAADPNITEADMDLAGGLLSRRVTSLAASNPQIRTLLKAVGEATGNKALMEEIMNTQDFYNILNRYYDIAPETGFQKLSQNAAANADSMFSATVQGVKNLAGKTDAVRQKALEKFLEELIGSTKK